MKTERKYLDEFEMSLLEKYGIKILKKKYDVSDLLDMLPKKWKEGNKRDRNESWNGIRIEYDYGTSEWTCTTPHWFYGGACGVVTWNIVRGDTLVECLLRAVLTLASKGDRQYLKKTYVVEDWKYSEN